MQTNLDFWNSVITDGMSRQEFNYVIFNRTRIIDCMMTIRLAKTLEVDLQCHTLQDAIMAMDRLTPKLQDELNEVVNEVQV